MENTICLRTAALALIAASVLGSAKADPITWTGEGDTTAWSDGGNWEGGTAPAKDDVAVLPAGATVGATQADVNLAFQIVNARYQDKKYVTIFSCELSTMELISIDEAVGSRIHERAKAYELYIAKDASKNFRIKDLFERS